MNLVVDLFLRVFLPLVGKPQGDDRMTAARGAAFAAAMRMIDRVHGDAAIVRTAAKPAGTAGLADRDVHVIGIRHRADGRHAAAMHETLLARIQAQDHVFAVAADDLGIGAGRTRDLPALADLQLDIVHDGADRDIAGRHRIARLHVDMLAGDNHVADRHALRGQDIGLLAVVVFHQRDEGGAVRIVFQPLDLRRPHRTCDA